MDPHALLPAPDALPIQWYWLQLLLILTGFLHSVAMNVMLGSGLIALTAPFLNKDDRQPMRQTVASTLPYSLSFTINFGVAPLLFLQGLYGQYFYTSSVLMASYWLALIGLLVVGYASLYLFNMRDENSASGSLFLSLAMGLFLVIAFLICNNMTLMQTPANWTAYFAERQGRLLNLGDQTLLPRYLHFLAAAVAVGGLAIALLYEFRKRQGRAECDRFIQYGCTWFCLATLINFGIGFWFLGSLPPATFAGATWFGKLFALMLLLAIFTVVMAAIQAMRFRVLPAAGWALATIFSMIVARALIRYGYLRDTFTPDTMPLAAQPGPFLLFLAVLAGGVWLAGWMLKISRSKPTTEGRP